MKITRFKNNPKELKAFLLNPHSLSATIVSVELYSSLGTFEFGFRKTNLENYCPSFFVDKFLSEENEWKNIVFRPIKLRAF